jgi:hypothetical protein
VSKVTGIVSTVVEVVAFTQAGPVGVRASSSAATEATMVGSSERIDVLKAIVSLPLVVLVVPVESQCVSFHALASTIHPPREVAHGNSYPKRTVLPGVGYRG